jgi:hypothetical protein
MGIGSFGFRDLWITDLWISGGLDLGFSGFSDGWFFLGSRIFCFSTGLGSQVFWMFGFSGSFRDLDRFRLLIQRCKRVGEVGNFFDKGRVLPDESTRAPGEGYDRGRVWQRGRRFVARRKGFVGVRRGVPAELEFADGIKTKPPRVFCFRGGNFFVRVNDRFSGSSRDHGWDGIIGRISLFPGQLDLVQLVHKALGRSVQTSWCWDKKLIF